MPPITRTMTRCSRCSRWQTFAPGDELVCGDPECKAECVPVDMSVHVATLPVRSAVHNHPPMLVRKPRGECEACDAEHLADEEARAKAKKAEAATPPAGEAAPSK